MAILQRTRICEYCGDAFIPVNTSRGRGRFCSTPCAGIGRSTHGACRRYGRTREYTAWQNMIARCYRPTWPDFHNYGGRGITVCARWRSNFAAFLEDLGRCSIGLSLDRVENAGNYEPGNCRWATKLEQCNNTRKNRRYLYQGVSRTLAEIARLTRAKPVSLRKHLLAGESVEYALAAILWHRTHGHRSRLPPYQGS